MCYQHDLIEMGQVGDFPASDGVSGAQHPAGRQSLQNIRPLPAFLYLQLINIEIILTFYVKFVIN